jgi:Cu(I)/Ag(I) efflux system membrane fusion protein
MGFINKGDKVEYTIQSIPGKTFSGTISYIDPVIDPKTRVAKARVERSNADLLLKPEMFASGIVEASTSTQKQSITVPKSAVMWTGTRSVVYVMQKSSQGVSFMMRVVTLGPELGDSYVIESGIEAGEEIAVHGTFSIDAAAQLAGKPSMMNPEGGVAMTGHNHGGTDNSPIENMPSTIKKTSISTSAKKSIEPLFESYFNFKTALASDDFKKAKQSGLALKSALANVDMNLFKGNAHAVWMELSSSLKNSLQHIEHEENIASQRESFIHISNGMIAIAESFEPNSSPIYIQHCPMANSDKGADWLSRAKEIRNPYFGESMLTCGEVTKKIK